MAHSPLSLVINHLSMTVTICRDIQPTWLYCYGLPTIYRLDKRVLETLMAANVCPGRPLRNRVGCVFLEFLCSQVTLYWIKLFNNWIKKKVKRGRSQWRPCCTFMVSSCWSSSSWWWFIDRLKVKKLFSDRPISLERPDPFAPVTTPAQSDLWDPFVIATVHQVAILTSL